MNKHIYLSSPTIYAEDTEFVQQALQKNEVSSYGENLYELTSQLKQILNCKYCLTTNSGTAAIHLALQAIKLQPNETVFCQDFTFIATINPVLYESGIPILIDSELDTWNMDPIALERAFEQYPHTRVVIIADIYGIPGNIETIQTICHQHNAILIEDAAESQGAYYKQRPCGTLGDIGIISFNGNKIITGGGGGALITNNLNYFIIAQKIANQSKESTVWYEHTDIGYNYRMNNVMAGMLRGQLMHLHEHLQLKKKIYERYKQIFIDKGMCLNPIQTNNSTSNIWLSCLQLPEQYNINHILAIQRLLALNDIESRPVWKPMHEQPLLQHNIFFTARAQSTSTYLFNHCLCLPSDIKMSEQEQDYVIQLILSYIGERNV